LPSVMRYCSKKAHPPANKRECNHSNSYSRPDVYILHAIDVSIRRMLIEKNTITGMYHAK
jgi:hypothetical protein